MNNLLTENKNRHGNYTVLTRREKEFLEWCTKDLTYSEISVKMGVGIRTIDYYRDSLFAKLDLNTRIGLTLYAIRIGLVSVHDL